MDALKVVPQAFFDFIARVVPGLAALFLLAWLEPTCWNSFATVLARLLGGKASDWTMLCLLMAAYIVGHLMTPGTKLVQRVTEKYPRIRNANGTWWKSWSSLNTAEEEESLKPNSKHYDWLRVKSPDAAGLAAKLRAEFTMYNSLAFVFLSFGAWQCVARGAAPYLGVSIAVLGVLMAARGRETQKTMCKCVENFYVAAGNH